MNNSLGAPQVGRTSWVVLVDVAVEVDIVGITAVGLPAVT
jgi:hypothetical protein